MSRVVSEREAITDLVYQAAVVGDLWPEALDRISQRLAARCTSVHALAAGALHWTACRTGRDFAGAWEEGRWVELGGRADALAALRHAGFASDAWSYDRAAKEAVPVYRDFLIPSGGGLAAATLVRSPHGDVYVVNVERPIDADDFTRAELAWLDSLRPHLMRAATLSARLGLEAAQSAVKALEVAGLPAAALNRKGDVRAANVAFERLTPSYVRSQAGRLRLVDGGADARFGLLLEAVTAGVGVGGSVPVRAVEDGPAFVAHLSPLRRAAQDVFPESLALVVLAPVGVQDVLSSDLVEVLFDLSAAEAAVARALAQGRTPAEIAAARGVSLTTVRSQIRAILVKTGRARQSDLTALLAVPVRARSGLR
jgi:DNA-binding CsgD family transcriptional regulator